MASEKNPGIHFYSGFREKNHKGGGGGQFEILKNPGIDFYSGFRKNPSIHFYSGFREKKTQGGCNSKS